MTPQDAWKDLKQKVNIQYYIGPNKLQMLNEFIGEPEADPTAADTADAIAALNDPNIEGDDADEESEEPDEESEEQ